jgi:DNA-binding CsgD family transcriptional regulator
VTVAGSGAAPGGGRDDALRVVADAVEGAARERRGRIVLISGEPGIGKSWLLDRCAEAAGSIGAVVGRGTAIEGGWQPPFTIWRDALGWEPADGGDGLSPSEAVFRRADLTRAHLQRLAAGAPVLLLLDDLHWADDDSLTLLSLLGHALAELPIVIVGAHRPASELLTPHLVDVRATLSRDDSVVDIELAGFSVDELRAYLVAAGADALAAQAEALWQDTGGNPLFAREFARDARRSDATAIGQSPDGSWPVPVPVRLRELVRQRVRRTSAAAQELLPRAALMPDACSVEVLAAISGFGVDEVAEVCDEAVAAGLLRVSGDGFAFEHAALRHALAHDFNPARIARRHCEIAVALLQHFGPDAHEHAAAVAYHVWLGARAPFPFATEGAPEHVAFVDQGVDLCRVAAGEATAEGGFQQAVQFLRMAIDIVQMYGRMLRAVDDHTATATLQSLWEDLALAEAAALQFEAADHTIASVADAFRRDGRTTELVAFLGRAARSLRDAGAPIGTWSSLADEGLARHTGPQDLGWARLVLLREPIEAVTHGRIHVGRWTGLDPSAVAIVRAGGDESDLPLIIQPYEWMTRADVDALVRDARTWRHPSARSHGFGVAARVLCFRFGDLAAAAALHEESAANAQRSGSVAGEADALAQRAFCVALTGDLAQGEAALERPQLLTDRLGPVHRVRFVVEVLAASSVAHVRGDGPFATWAEAAVGVVTNPAAGANVTATTLAAFAAWAHAMAGDADAAATVMNDIVPILATLPLREYTVNGGVAVVARAAWETQDPTHAAKLLARTHQLLADGITASAFGPLAATAGQLSSLAGDDAAATSWFATARQELDAQDLPPLRALVAFDELRAARRAGREPSDQAIAAVDAAFTELSMTGWRTRLDRWRAGDAAPERTRRTEAPDGLSPREVEVLRLLAAGGSNKGIARDLYLSPATVQRHVANIYLKIDARNRAEATTYAHRHGIV